MSQKEKMMKRRHLITIRAPEDRNYKYRIDFDDIATGVGMVYFAHTEKEVLGHITSHRKTEPLQLSLFEEEMSC